VKHSGIRKPSPAMVVAILALVAALTGVAWAATAARNSVSSKSIKPGAVRSSDVRNNALTAEDLDDSASGLGTYSARINGLGTGTEVRYGMASGLSESSLDPNAVSLLTPNLPIVIGNLEASLIRPPGGQDSGSAAPPGGQNSRSVTITNGGADTPVGCTMTGGTAGCDSGDATAKFDAGDLIEVEIASDSQSGPLPAATTLVTFTASTG
jgi:hypothetical protein